MDGAFRIGLGWRALLEMTGRDRVRFLHGMCTQDIKTLRPGQGCMAAIVNRQGKMVGDLIVLATEEALLLQMDRANLAPVAEHLARFLVADDVALQPSPAPVLGVYGPGARDLLGVPDLPDFHHVLRDGARIARNRTISPDGFDVIGTPDPAAEPADSGRYETLRIRSGFPRWGVDMDGTMLPMEAGLEPVAVSYTKGCYIGQEVIQRVKTYSEPPRMLVSLEIEGAEAPAVPAPILVGGREVGRATSAAPASEPGKTAAIGLVPKEHRTPGTKLSVGGREAVVRPAPWQARFATS